MTEREKELRASLDVPTPPAIFHGGDHVSAMTRAVAIRGHVHFKRAPRNASPNWGYWSLATGPNPAPGEAAFRTNAGGQKALAEFAAKREGRTA